MDGFVNRAAELAALQRWWDSGSGVAAIWGRRRVGKTALAAEIARGRAAVFHSGAGRGEVGELELLSREVAKTVPGGTGGPYQSWDAAFDDLRSRIRGEPILLVLDDLADLLDSPGLVAALRGAAERPGDGPGLRVVLCSASVRHMEAIQRPGQPLHEVASTTVRLAPFTPAETARMLPGLSPTDRARVYGIVGGTPLYLTWWDQDTSVEENLDRLVCRPGAPLLTELDLLLGADLDDQGFTDRILHALANGLTSYNDVRDWTRTEPARPLDRLIEQGLIERILPVGESRQARRRRYRVVDPFVRFALGVVAPHRSAIDRGLTGGLPSTLVDGADRTMHGVWAEAFRTHLRGMADEGELPVDTGTVKVGPWWDNTGNAEIDALALAGQAGTPVLAGSATWEPVVDAGRKVATLRRKVERGLGAYPNQLRYAVCARDEVRDAPYDVLTLTARDLFAPA